MAKNRVKKMESLSPTEQKIYSNLYSERVISTKDVKDILGDSHKTADYITNLREKGYLQKIRKGIYTVVPPSLIGKEYNPDKFHVARKLKEEYCISYHSALELHGIAQSSYKTVWITVKNYSKSFTYKSIDYKFTTTKHYFGHTEKDYQGASIKVSDREKTLLDCIRRPKRAGGIEETVKSLNNLPSVNWEKLTRYLKKFNEKTLCQKTGFILEEIDIETPKEIHRFLSDKIGEKTPYLDKNKESRYNKKWNLMVPKNLKELLQNA